MIRDRKAKIIQFTRRRMSERTKPPSQSTVDNDNPKPFTREEILGGEAWRHYERLRDDARMSSVKSSLSKRGMSDERFDFLLQHICVLPQIYQSQSSLDITHFPGLETIGKTLRSLITEQCAHPDLGDYLIEVEIANGRPGTPRHYRTLRVILESVAMQVEQPVQEHRAQKKAEAASRMKTRGTKRPRAISVRSRVILGIYDTINALLPVESENGPPRRSHNKETAVLASIVLQVAVVPNEVSHLRTGIRRQYAK